MVVRSVVRIVWKVTTEFRKDGRNQARRGDRAAEGAALEMLCGRKFTAGSNPALSVMLSAESCINPYGVASLATPFSFCSY